MDFEQFEVVNRF